MKATLSLMPLLLLCATLPAAAQPVYKCTHDGKVTYSEAPCPQGSTAVLDVPAPPPVQPDVAADLKRLQAESKALEKQRHAREAREDRADAAQNRIAARRNEHCEKLRLARKWAEEDARRATPQATEGAQLRARRAAERYAAECT